MAKVGAILLVLLGMVILGNLWFFGVEAVLGRFRRWLGLDKEPLVWHTLSEEKDKEEPNR